MLQNKKTITIVEDYLELAKINPDFKKLVVEYAKQIVEGLNEEQIRIGIDTRNGVPLGEVVEGVPAGVVAEIAQKWAVMVEEQLELDDDEEAIKAILGSAKGVWGYSLIRESENDVDITKFEVYEIEAIGESNGTIHIFKDNSGKIQFTLQERGDLELTGPDFQNLEKILFKISD